MKNIYNQNLIHLYRTALLEIRKHLAVSGSELLGESIISKDSIKEQIEIYKVFKLILLAVPQHFQLSASFLGTDRLHNLAQLFFLGFF